METTLKINGLMVNESTPHYKIQLTELILLSVGSLLLLVDYQLGLDFIVADFIYSHFQWGFKTSFVVDGLLHKLARIILIIIYLGMVFSLIKKRLKGDDPIKAYNLFILILTIGLSVAIVSIAKRFTDVDCPWDLIRYGGEKPFFPMFNYNKAYQPSAHCFPASHASVGYSWVALYFYFKVTQNKAKFMALICVISMGLIFGFAQQLRGAHFMSHDVWSFLICVLNPILIYSWAYSEKRINNITDRFKYG